MKERDTLAVKCISCAHLTKEIDNRGWVHYKCPFASNREWLGGYCREPLEENCGQYIIKKISHSCFKN